MYAAKQKRRTKTGGEEGAGLARLPGQRFRVIRVYSGVTRDGTIQMQVGRTACSRDSRRIG